MLFGLIRNFNLNGVLAPGRAEQFSLLTRITARIDRRRMVLATVMHSHDVTIGIFE
jgi:hypothetical protein